jgi:hypothetical protein
MFPSKRPMNPTDEWGWMSNTDPIQDATRRLVLALEALDEATERRCEADRAERNHFHALENDRARLANDLDDATARVRALETINLEVAQRIDQAIGTIRSALESSEQAPDNSKEQ